MKMTWKSGDRVKLQLARGDLRTLAGGLGEMWNALSDRELRRRVGIGPDALLARIKKLHEFAEPLAETSDGDGAAGPSSKAETHATIEFTKDELRLLAAGLLETSRAVAAWEFHPRLGVDFEDAMALLAELEAIIRDLND